MRYDFLQHGVWSCGAVDVSLLDLGLCFTDTQRLLTLFGMCIVQVVDLAILQKLFERIQLRSLGLGEFGSEWKICLSTSTEI